MTIRNIAFIIPTLAAGGAERVVIRLAAELQRYYNCFVFVSHGAIKEYIDDSLTVVEIDYSEAGLTTAFESYSIDLVSDHYHWSRAHVEVMAQIIDRTGIPVVLTEHNSYYYPLFQACREKVEGQSAYFSSRYDIYKKFAAVTVLNEDNEWLFSRHLDNVILTANPISYESNGTANYDSRTAINVSHFGKAAKRIDVLYKSFATTHRLLPTARLKIAGHYNYLQDQFLRKANGLESAHISCIGRSSMIAHHYNESAVFALSSDIEGQPMVLLEAALHAMPQVVFDITGIRDQIIDGETGFIIPLGDTQAFGERVAELLANPRLGRRVGEASRDFVADRFSMERIVRRWKELFDHIEREGRWHGNVDSDIAPDRLAAHERTLGPAHAANMAYWGSNASWISGFLDAPKVSFLVPVYGTEALLGRCLRSIQAQSLQEFECIIVDDASPGNVAAVTAAVVGDDPRFRVIRHAKNRGLHQARSTAAAIARGTYFSNIDSDDYIHPEFARTLYELAITTGSEIVECGAVELEVDGTPIRFNGAAPAGVFDGENAQEAFFNGSLRNVVWNKMYARELWQRISEHNDIDLGINISEDTLRNAYLFPATSRYAFTKDCLYLYCRRVNSVVKGGNLASLSKKLQDIEYSYTYSMRHVLGPCKDSKAFVALERKRNNDILWYIAEYLGRTSWADVEKELHLLPESRANTLSPLVYIVRKHEDIKQWANDLNWQLRQKTDAWLWERDRADGLIRRLKEIITQ